MADRALPHEIRDVAADGRPFIEARRALRFLREGASHRLQVWAARLFLLLLLCGAWELTAKQRWMNPVFIGRPSGILRAFWQGIQGPLLAVDARATVQSTVVGFLLAAAAGIVVAVVLSRIRMLEEIFQPLFTAMNSLPRVALAPLFVMWFGVGALSKVALAASLVFFVVFLNTMAGIQGVDRDHLTLARVLGASPAQTFLKFTLPSAIPSIFAGLELGMIYGFLGTVAGEMLAGEQGIGVQLQAYSGLFKTDEFFAALLLLVLITTTISIVLRAIRIRLLWWQTLGLAQNPKSKPGS
jgi:ABC-type nitrate/sulfonate/bicarbonate transport system permease component